MSSVEKIKSKLNSISVEQLKEIISMLANDFREGVDIVFECALDELMNRVSESDYINFLNSI